MCSARSARLKRCGSACVERERRAVVTSHSTRFGACSERPLFPSTGSQWGFRSGFLTLLVRVLSVLVSYNARDYILVRSLLPYSFFRFLGYLALQRVRAARACALCHAPCEQ